MSLNEKQQEESLQSAYAILRLLGQIEGEMAVIGVMPGDPTYWGALQDNLTRTWGNARQLCISLHTQSKAEGGK